MAKKKKNPVKDQVWIDAGKLANHKQEPWKLPLPDFIEELYFKRLKKDRPKVVKSTLMLHKQHGKNVIKSMW